MRWFVEGDKETMISKRKRESAGNEMEEHVGKSWRGEVGG